jgi:hypothetical protein
VSASLVAAKAGDEASIKHSPSRPRGLAQSLSIRMVGVLGFVWRGV